MLLVGFVNGGASEANSQAKLVESAGEVLRRNPYPRLLRVRRERPRCRCASKDTEKCAPSHSITSSA
jgi:hypothetical protein